MEKDLFLVISEALSRYKMGHAVCPVEEKLCVGCKIGDLKCERKALELAAISKTDIDENAFEKMIKRAIRLLGVNSSGFRQMIDEARDS